jgi:hypothetical protein
MTASDDSKAVEAIKILKQHKKAKSLRIAILRGIEPRQQDEIGP